MGLRRRAGACFHWPHHLLSGSWELRQSQMPAVRNTSKRVLHGMPQVRRQTPSILSKLQGTGGVGLEGLPSMYHSTSGNPDGHSGSGTPQGSNWVEGACSYNPCTNLFDRSFDLKQEMEIRKQAILEEIKDAGYNGKVINGEDLDIFE